MISLLAGNRSLLAAACLLVIAGSVVSVMRTRQKRHTKIDYSPFEALGTVLAEETAKLAETRGQILILTYSPAQGLRPNVDASIRGFQKAIGKLTPESSVIVEPVNAEVYEVEGRDGLSAARFAEAIRKHSEATTVISLVGPLLLDDSQPDPLPEKMPTLVVYMGASGLVKAQLQSDLIQLAAMPRFPPAPHGAKRSADPREMFDRYWQIVTPATAGSLPD